MKRIAMRLFATLTLLFSFSLFADDLHGDAWLYTQTSESQKSMTPDKALQMLKEGNSRFINGSTKSRNLLQQVRLTGKKGQYPFAIVLSCMDSRGSPELIFDQGIGDIFSIRLAGNVLDQDQLGGLEYATKAVGSHLIVVMGHTRCGAVAGACSNVELGNLTQLLQKIQPAVITVKRENSKKEFSCDDTNIVDQIAAQNVLNVIKEISEKSPVIRDLIASGKVRIVGAMQDLKTGAVKFDEQ
jgi:carbonic anhydrase